MNGFLLKTLNVSVERLSLFYFLKDDEFIENKLKMILNSVYSSIDLL